MSCWTYVLGTIKVNPMGRTEAESEYILRTVLSHLPEVSGSEGPMETYINKLEGHNCSANHDEFFNRSNLGSGIHGNMFHMQEDFLITVNGALRDREFLETVKEFAKWMTRFSKRCLIKECLVRVVGYNEDKIFTNDYDSFSDLYEWDNNWSDYLRWEPDKDEKGYIKGKPNKKERINLSFFI